MAGVLTERAGHKDYNSTHVSCFLGSGLTINLEKKMLFYFAFLWLNHTNYRVELGYHCIGLEIRFQTVPIFLVFRIQLGRKSRKQQKKVFFFHFAVLWLNQGTNRVGKGTSG